MRLSQWAIAALESALQDAIVAGKVEKLSGDSLLKTLSSAKEIIVKT